MRRRVIPRTDMGKRNFNPFQQIRPTREITECESRKRSHFGVLRANAFRRKVETLAPQNDRL